MCDCGGGGGGGDCCAPNGTAGCEDAGCEATVCAADAFCCDSEWDQICADEAADMCGAMCGGGGAGGCCDPQDGPGCEDGVCEAIVCGQDPFCCDSQWDQLCADAAAQACDCGGGGGGGGCCDPQDGPGCEDAACEASVCGADPFCCDTQWDQICADAAAQACNCGGGGGGGCCVPGDGTGCPDDPGCEALICAADPFCCDSQWDQICADAAVDACECGGGAGGGCCDPGDAPGCDDAGCEAIVCGADPFCCDTQWDDLCAEAAVASCDCGGGGGASCCVPGDGPGCDDAACEATVCGADPFCCDTQWDQICADAANQACDCGGGGSDADCCIAHDAPGCSDFPCEATVCDADPFCCDSQWDDLCADAANQVCAICEGGGGGGGDCCAAKETPGCDDATCEATICGADEFCCDASWDQICADAAAQACAVCEGGGGTGGDCCAPHDGTGCDDGGCEATVCGADPFCCDTQWDQICADEAADMCGALCGGGGGGASCCDPQEGPGCGDAGCEATVCGADPFCCDTQWDQICADAAVAQCAACSGGGGGGGGDCCVANGSAGCDDGGCQASVCGADPFCCDTEWDQLCADAAADMCAGCGGGGGGGGGDCCIANGTPGCADAACQSAICGADAFCCDSQWDQICADAAVAQCAACSGGGGGGGGDCCVANGSAGCDDGGCQASVCGADPFCCDTEWDQICADEAADMCAGCGGGGGGGGGGDCCAANGTPGCGDSGCQASVCGADPFCCDTEWDQICADEAADMCAGCGGGGGGGGGGDCCAANGTPGCGDSGCQASVCGADPFCCDNQWDQLCADAAADMCAGCGGGGGGGGGGDCCVANGTPGCGDSGCQASVCGADPFCCDNQWDQLCADAAADMCAGCGGGGGGGGSDCCVANGSPGCSDGACQSAICGQDPFCCDTQWDQICADAAAQTCSGC